MSSSTNPSESISKPDDTSHILDTPNSSQGGLKRSEPDSTPPGQPAKRPPVRTTPIQSSSSDLTIPPDISNLQQFNRTVTSQYIDGHKQRYSFVVKSTNNLSLPKTDAAVGAILEKNSKSFFPT